MRRMLRLLVTRSVKLRYPHTLGIGILVPDFCRVFQSSIAVSFGEQKDNRNRKNGEDDALEVNSGVEEGNDNPKEQKCNEDEDDSIQ